MKALLLAAGAADMTRYCQLEQYDIKHSQLVVIINLLGGYVNCYQSKHFLHVLFLNL